MLPTRFICLAALVIAVNCVSDVAQSTPADQADGYRGIWYSNQPTGDEYAYKYSGGLGTYPQQHSPIAICSAAANKTFFCYGGAVVPHGTTVPMPKTGAIESSPATIIVTLPADAKLMIDDFATTSTSATRVFVTPALAPEKEFSYTLKAEITRNGKTEVQTEKVTVRAGRETPITMNFPAAVAAK